MPDATITSTASTFGTISGVFSADQSTISGTISGIVPGTLTGSVGVPGPAGPAGIGLPAGGTSGQFLQKTSGVDYATDWVTVNLTGLATESWVTAGFYPLTGNPSSFLTASALTPYLTSATAASTYQTLSGMSSYLTTSAAASTYQTLAGMSDYLAKAGNLAGLANTGTARTNLGLGSLAVVNDAPSDGSQYARKNGAWDVVTTTPDFISSVSSPLSVTTGNLSIDLSAYAPLASPVFTGDARAVTPAFGDNDTSIATTAFVQAGLLGGTAVARNLEVEVRNQSGSTIAAGSIVYISGATGNKPLITLAQANNDANSAQTIGFVKTAIANNGTGYVIVRGELENIDTSALTEGVQLYLSPTTAGTWTTTKPSAPQHLVYVGIVVRSHPTLGVILVSVQNGYELDELHNVAALTPANNDLLAYESSTDLWKNKTYSTLGLLTSATAASTYQTLAGMSSYLTTSAAATNYVAKSGSAMTGGLTFSAGGYIGTFSMLAGNSITIPDGGAEIYETVLQNPGLLIRDASNVVLARFQANQVLIPSAGITFSDATTQTSAGITAATAASTYYPLTGNPSSYITSSALTPYALLSGATFTGKINTPAVTTASAFLSLPHGTAPTSPVNGDIWSTTGGIFVRVNGATRQLGDTSAGLTYTGNNTFSGPTLSFGTSTAASTINVGTGATLTATTKAVNIGTGGVAGSTTNITIGSTAGTSTTTLQGSTVGVTLAADTNTTGLATTAYVVGQAGSATPLVNGTAAVGTSLRYARQDHVHPTDTTRLAVASNLSDLASASTARTNLGLGTAAVEPATKLVPAGGTTGQVLAKSSATDWDDAWITIPSGYITSVSSPLAVASGNLTVDLSSYLTSATAASTYYLQTNPAGYQTAAQVTSALSPYLTSATAASTYAPLASPALTGVPTAPTAANGTNTTQIATTAYVLANAGAVTSVAGRTGAVTLAVADVSGAAPLASPSLTGVPLSTTAAVDTNTTQIATTAFVVGQAAAATPLVDGTAAVGTSLRYARADHVHPTDTTRAALNSPTFTGTPSLPTGTTGVTQTAGTNNTTLATTAFVRADNNVKAWVNFNGSGTISIRGSFNVSSITDNGVGDYTVNFTTALADINYTGVASGSIDGTTAAWTIGFAFSMSTTPFVQAPTTTTARFTFSSTTNTANRLDPQYGNIVIIR